MKIDFKKLNLFFVAFIAAIFIFFYFIVFVWIFKNPNIFIFLLSIVYFVLFIIGVIVVCYGFKIKKNEYRKYLFLAGAFFMISSMVCIPVSLYINCAMLFNRVYCIPSLMINVFGFLSLLYYLNKLKYD